MAYSFIKGVKMTDHLFENNEIFGGWFNDWRRARVNKMTQVVGEDWFKGKTVLEVGAGYGNVGLHLKHALGADVTFTDARTPCLEAIQKKDPTAKVYAIDHDTEWSLPDKYDCIVHFGLSYNLRSWKQDLNCAIQMTKNYMFYETAVNKFEGDVEFSIQDWSYHHEYHGPANFVGCLPSVSNIEKQFDRNPVRYERYDDEDLNVQNLVYTNKNNYQFKKPKLEGKEDQFSYVINSWDNEFVCGGRKFWVIKRG